MTPTDPSAAQGLHCRHGGRSDGRGTVLWIHGLGESGLGLESVLGRAEIADWDHAQLDLPGYGKTPHPARAVGLEEHAAVLLEWLDRGRSTPAVLIGHSMGGVIGQLMAERRPDAVRAFLNVEGNISLDDCTWSRRAMDWSEEEFVASGIGTLAEEIRRAAESDPAHASYYPSVCLCHAATLRRNAEELVRLSSGESLAARLGSLDLPVSYLYGGRGGTGSHSRRLLESAGISPLPVEAAGHWPWIDQPDLFIDEVATFLTTLPSP